MKNVVDLSLYYQQIQKILVIFMLFFFSKGPAVQCKDFREREAQKNISAFVGVEEHRKKKAEVNLLKGHIHKIRTG